MRIYCPQCNVCYELDETLIPEGGRKLRCSNCGEVFRFDKNGVQIQDAMSELQKLMQEQMLSEDDVAEETVEDSSSVVDGDDIKDNVEEAEVDVESSGLQNENASKQEEAAQELEQSKESEQEETAVSFDDDTAKVDEQASKEEIEKLEEKPEVDMRDIFERLNEQSERLFQEEQKMPLKDRLLLQLKTMLGLNRKINYKLVGIVCAVVALVAVYNYRYEIARSVPLVGAIYKILGIKAHVPGEGLEFQNINWNFIENEAGRVLEVKGFIYNPTDREIDIPTVRVEILDKDTVLQQSINQKPTVQSLKPDSRIAVGVIVKSPSPTAKYVYMTFIDLD